MTTPLEVRSPVQIQVSSGSEVSVVSTAERQKRCDIARLKRELAETLAAEAQAKLDPSSGSRVCPVAMPDYLRHQ